jgi:hypothetical protein
MIKYQQLNLPYKKTNEIIRINFNIFLTKLFWI